MSKVVAMHVTLNLRNQAFRRVQNGRHCLNTAEGLGKEMYFKKL